MSSPTEEVVRAEIDQWIADNFDPDASLVEWRDRLVTAGWMVPSWPERWFGRGLPSWVDRVVNDALRDAGAVGQPIGSGMSLAAPTILEIGRAHV